jgi:hypothetical protein
MQASPISRPAVGTIPALDATLASSTTPVAQKPLGVHVVASTLVPVAENPSLASSSEARKPQDVPAAAASSILDDDEAEEEIDEDHGEGSHDYDDDDDDSYALHTMNPNDPRGLFMDGKDASTQSPSDARGMSSQAFVAIPIPTSFSASVKVQPNSAESDANRIFVVQRIVRSSGGYRPFFQFQVW